MHLQGAAIRQSPFSPYFKGKNIMNDLVSIIIPTYNRETMISECLASVTAQSHQNYEVIVIDDGSTDSTVELIKKLQMQDNRIRLICNLHQGVSAARNAGLDAAKGEFVFFLDSDDVIHPNLLAYLVNNMNTQSADIGCCLLCIVPATKWQLVPNRIESSSRENHSQCKDWEAALNDMFYHYTSTPLSGAGSIMIRRSLVGDTRFRPELSVGEDFFFNYQNVVKKPRVSILQQKWYYVRQHNQNTAHQPSVHIELSRLRRRKLVWESEDRFGRKEIVRHQKQSALTAYLNSIRYAIKEAIAILQKEMKSYKSAMRPDLRFKSRILFFLGVNFTNIYLFLLRAKHPSLKK